MEIYGLPPLDLNANVAILAWNHGNEDIKAEVAFVNCLPGAPEQVR